MAKWLGMKLNMSEAVAEMFGIGINYIFFLGMIVLFFLTKEKWQEALFLTAILVHFIPSNYEYTSVYYLVVLMIFLKENTGCICEQNIGRRIYLVSHGVGFALLFSTDFLMLYYRYGLISGMFTVMYLMIAVNIINVFWNMIEKNKRTRSSQSAGDRRGLT